MTLFRKLFPILIAASPLLQASAQTTVFAELQGSPVINTTGWNLTGIAGPGDTNGDANTDNDELVLTPPQGDMSGAVFFAQPVNLAQCTQWKATFDFRIWDGSAADGLAFCYLDVPPSGFVSGGGLGIPLTANGLKVCFDTYDNGCGVNPEIQVFSGAGYNECIAGIQKVTGMNFIRSNTYNSAEINFNNGTVTVKVNGTTYLTATGIVIPATGYVGFTAGTGNNTDRHSIRNVTVYADIATSNAGPNVSYCHGGSATIGTTPTAGYTYSWTPALGLSATNVANPTVTLSNAGNTPLTFTYTVTTTLTGASAACPTQDQVVVTVNPIPTSPFTLNKTSVCPGEPVTVTYTGNMGPGAGYAWNFDGGTVISGSGQGPYQVSWSTDGPKQVTLTVTAAGCFSTVTTKNLTVNPAPIVSVTAPADICLGDTATLTATATVPGSVFVWQPDSIVANPILVSPGTTTSYTVLAISPNGCVSADTTFTLSVKLVPVASITGDTLICNGDSTLLTGSGSLVGSTLMWLPDSETTAQIWASPNENQTYSLLATKDGCTSDTAFFTLLVDSVPNLTVPDSLQICIGEEISVTVSSTTPGTLFDWSPGALTGNVNVLAPTVTTEYQVYAYNQNCTSETKPFVITVLQNCDCKLIVPNIFTPNGDQVNDVFNVQNPQTCEISAYEFVLYNRWGDLVWRSEKVEDLWSGKCLMGNCSDGTYFWVITYSYIPGGSGSPKTVTDKGMLNIAK